MSVRRVAVAMLSSPRWVPPGVDPDAWRLALAEDMIDVLATLAEVEGAVALPDAGLRGRVGWPGVREYVVPALDVARVLAAAAADGFEQAVLLAGDAPDLPAMLIGKLLRPLTTRPVAAAPAPGSGLLGLAVRLPAPTWLPAADLDALSPQALRRLAPRATDVAPAPGWHRMRGPEDLARLDPGLEGWEATRALLTSGSARP
jgi:hypothetical protein